MESKTCIHQEQIESFGEGIKRGTCKLCGQVREYNTLNPREKPTVIKLGRVNGAIVLPGPEDILNLSAQEAGELAAAKKAQNDSPPPPSETKVSPGDQVAIAPPKPQGRSRHLPKYYEDNKPAILQDYYRLKLKEFFTKWHLSTQYWQNLKKLWAVKGKGRGTKARLPKSGRLSGRSSAAAERAETINRGKVTLPSFPAFNDSWAFTVQEKWFETYKELRQMEVKQ